MGQSRAPTMHKGTQAPEGVAVLMEERGTVCFTFYCWFYFCVADVVKWRLGCHLFGLSSV
jgi:hypothetical protein